jgi:hypothetical protein
VTSASIFDICSTARLDFAATAAPNQNFYSLLYANPANTLTRFGVGDYSYSIAAMPLNQVITLAYWTSAFVQVNPGQVAQGSNINLFANYSNTFDLMSIDLFDANNDLITDWTLMDLTDNSTVFTSTGRVVSAPEPSSLALFGIGLLAVGMLRRKRALLPS